MNCSDPVFTPACCTSPIPIMPPTISSHNPEDVSFASLLPNTAHTSTWTPQPAGPGEGGIALLLCSQLMT